MKILKQLIQLHKILFIMAVLTTVLSVIFNLCWNKYLAQLLDGLGNTEMHPCLTTGILIVLIHTASEFLSTYLSSYTCEIFAHEMRMGYARYYVQSDIRTLSANLMKSVFLCLETKLSGALFKLCIIYGLLCAVLFVYNGIIWTRYAAFSAKAEIELQKKMFGKMLSLPLKRIDHHFSGEWITRLNSDIQAAFTMMNGPLNIPHLAVAIINILLSCLLMLKSSVLFWQ